MAAFVLKFDQNLDRKNVWTGINESVEGVPSLTSCHYASHATQAWTGCDSVHAPLIGLHVTDMEAVTTAALHLPHYSLQPASSIKQRICSFAGMTRDWIPNIQKYFLKRGCAGLMCLNAAFRSRGSICSGAFMSDSEEVNTTFSTIYRVTGQLRKRLQLHSMKTEYLVTNKQMAVLNEAAAVEYESISLNSWHPQTWYPCSRSFVLLLYPDFLFFFWKNSLCCFLLGF